MMATIHLILNTVVVCPIMLSNKHYSIWHQMLPSCKRITKAVELLLTTQVIPFLRPCAWTCLHYFWYHELISLGELTTPIPGWCEMGGSEAHFGLQPTVDSTIGTIINAVLSNVCQNWRTKFFFMKNNLWSILTL